MPRIWLTTLIFIFSCGSEPQVKQTRQEAQEAPHGAMLVSGVDQLPSCNQERKGQLFYAAKEQTFYYCDSKSRSFKPISLEGLKGEQGQTGEKGHRGGKGSVGVKGEKGAKGEKGLKGEKGVSGAKGSKGNVGEKGAKGEKGLKGEKGALGQKGEKGDSGTSYQSNFARSATVAPGEKITLTHGLGHKNLVTLGQFIKDGKVYDFRSYKKLFGRNQITIEAYVPLRVAKLQDNKVAATYKQWSPAEDDYIMHGVVLNQDLDFVVQPKVIPGLQCYSVEVATSGSNIAAACQGLPGSQYVGHIGLFDASLNAVNTPVSFAPEGVQDLYLRSLSGDNLALAWRESGSNKQYLQIFNSAGAAASSRIHFSTSSNGMQVGVTSTRIIIVHKPGTGYKVSSFKYDGTDLQEVDLPSAWQSITMAATTGDQFALSYVDGVDNKIALFDNITQTGATPHSLLAGNLAPDAIPLFHVKDRIMAFAAEAGFIESLNPSDLTLQSTRKLETYFKPNRPALSLEDEHHLLSLGEDRFLGIMTIDTYGTTFFTSDFRKGEITMNAIDDNTIEMINETGETLDLRLSVLY